MTCRHQEGDPTCTAGKSPADMRKKAEAMWRKWGPQNDPPTPDCEQYSILDVEQVGKHLILKVQYPSCAKCSYEGTKVMVFLGCSMRQALLWKRLDPHFQEQEILRSRQEAPPPDARFPASDQGWEDALTYARSKST